MDDLSNRTIKGYEFKECVGKGGFGAVYRAYQPTVGREVAIKVILPQHANQPDFIRRFEVEAQLVARLENPHIVPLYDYWREPDGAFLVMRWLRGSLRKALQRGPWSSEATSHLLEQIAAALMVAHREGVIHRDIKPDNILLDEDDNAYLADFGIAKNLSITDGNITQAGAVVGSPAYITPEQITGDPVTPRTDIYSLGVVLYEALVGEQPYTDATTPYELMSRHLNTPLPALHVRRPHLPAALNEVLQTATAKDPAQRYANALRFAAAFRAALPNLQRGPAQPLAEPLTERELDIIRLMMDGLSNTEIAVRLVLSAATVKWYVQQIYSKLDVHSRRQAVDRAKQLNLSVHTPLPAVINVPTVQSTEAQRPSVAAPELVNPYKGLRAFQEADAADFFGRAALTEQLLARLADGGDGSRFLAVVGPSGSGKSSVVRAGLIPALRRGGLLNSNRWFITEMIPGTHPLEELELALLRVASGPQTGLLSQLSEDRRGLVRAVKRVLPADQDIELVLVIDQFEEVFTLVTDETIRSHFIDNLLSAATDPRSRVRIVLTLRADFYDRPLLYPRLAELMRSHTEVVVPLSSDELERAVAGPAERVGLTLEPGLVATIIRDVGEQPGMLPLLQYALTELYERRQDRKLTLEAYRVSGGIRGALVRRAEELYSDLDAAAQLATRQLFLRLVTLGEGTEDTRRRVLLTELTYIGNLAKPDGAKVTALDEAMQVFAEYRLLTFDRDPITRSPTVEMAHEALIREWGRLREWLDASRDDLRVQRRLMAAAAEWEHTGHDPSFLAAGARLAQLEALPTTSQVVLNQQERAYLEASLTERERQTLAEQQRQAREKTLERRLRNFLRGLVAVLVIATLVGFGLAAFAITQNQVAQQNAVMADRNAAESQNVALVAGSQAELAKGNTDLAIALALQAVTLDPTSTPAQVALGQAAYAPGTVRRFTGHTRAVSSVAFSPDGRTVLSGADDLILWDVATGQIIRRFTGGHSEGRIKVAFSPDGRTALSGADDSRVILWDVTTGAIIRRFEGHGQRNGAEAPTGWIGSVNFSPDGRTALTCAWDKTLILWDVATAQIIRRFIGGHTEGVQACVLSADGRTALSGSGDKQVILWDVATGAIIRQLAGEAYVYSVALSPDGHYALAATNAVIYLWDMTTGQVVRRLIGHTVPVYSVAFSADGRTALSAGGDSLVIRWNVETGQVIRRFQGHTDSAIHVAFSPDGRYALSGSADTTVRLWDLDGGQVIQRFAGHKAGVWGVALSRDGRLAISGAWDGNAVLWDMQTGRERHRLTETNIWGVAFSPDSRTALVAVAPWGPPEKPGDVILWDVETGQVIRRFVGHQAPAIEVVFSPDGRTFLSGDGDGSVFLWDVATGQIIRRFVGHTPQIAIHGIAFSPDGRMALTSGFDGVVILWDVATGQIIHRLEGHKGPVFGVSFSRDGRTALTSGTGMFLWDVASGTILHRFPAGQGEGYSAFGPDDRTVLAVAGDNTTILSDAATGTVLRQFIRPEEGINRPVFSVDRRTILIGFGDGRLELWRNDSLSELIAWTHGNRYVIELACEQRQRYRLTPACDANGVFPTRTPFPMTAPPVATGTAASR